MGSSPIVSTLEGVLSPGTFMVLRHQAAGRIGDVIPGETGGSVTNCSPQAMRALPSRPLIDDESVNCLRFRWSSISSWRARM